MQLNVAVMFGGRSVEHEVSIITAVQCMDMMDTDKYKVIPIYISKEGMWYTGEALRHIENYRDFNKLFSRCKKVLLSNNANEHLLFMHMPSILGRNIVDRIDVIFPAFHGSHGEDGCIQGLYELINIPYVGCHVIASALGMDKIVMKSLFKEHRIPVLDYLYFHGSEWLKDRTQVIERIEKQFPYPLVAKPYNLGSSIGVSMVSNRADLEEAVDTIVNFAAYTLIEPKVQNLKEVNCSILGDHDYVDVSVCEEPVREKEVLSFQDKYLAGGGKSQGMTSLKRKIPAEISEEMRKQIQGYAKTAFLAMDCSGVVRFDFLIDQVTQNVYLNEPNTIPGSLAFYLWEASNVPFKKLIDQLIYLALKKFREKNNLIFTYTSNILSDFTKGGAKGAKGGKI